MPDRRSYTFADTDLRDRLEWPREEGKTQDPTHAYDSPSGLRAKLKKCVSTWKIVSCTKLSSSASFQLLEITYSWCVERAIPFFQEQMLCDAVACRSISARYVFWVTIAKRMFPFPAGKKGTLTDSGDPELLLLPFGRSCTRRLRTERKLMSEMAFWKAWRLRLHDLNLGM